MLLYHAGSILRNYEYILSRMQYYSFLGDPMEYQPDGSQPAVTDTPTSTKPKGFDAPIPTSPEQQQLKTECKPGKCDL